MRRISCIAALMLAGSPAFAFDVMTQSACQNAYEKAANLVAPNNATVGLQIQFLRVTDDGWCQLRSTDPGFEDLPATSLDWRMDGALDWAREGIPPQALEVRIAGLVPEGGAENIPPLAVEVTLRQDPDAGLLILERAEMSNEFGDTLSVSGVFERVYLMSLSMMQVSLGSAAFKAGLLSMTLEGTHENPFGFYGKVDVTGTPQTQSQAAFDAISRLPEGVMDDASRAEMTAFAADLPKPVGTLDVTVASERGLGLIQVGSAIYRSASTMLEDGALSEEMDILFDGLSVVANWTPKATRAD